MEMVWYKCPNVLHTGVEGEGGGSLSPSPPFDIKRLSYPVAGNLTIGRKGKNLAALLRYQYFINHWNVKQ